MDVYECISFLLVRDGQVLLETRAKDKETDPGLISIPGGHIEVGETQQQALVRELKEELDIAPDQYQYLCTLYHPTQELQLIHFYVITRWQGNIVSHEADAVNWYLLEHAPADTDADRLAIAEYLRVGHVLSFG